MDEMKNEDKITKMLRKVGTEKPSESFTEKIMGKIQVQEETETVKDRITQNILKKAGIEQPSVHFAHNVMQQVYANAESTLTTYKPAISKTGWYLIAAFILAVISISFISSAPTPESSVAVDAISKAQPYISATMEVINDIVANIVVSVPLMTGILVLAFLLFAERLMRRKPALV